jgi:hypothetical protein
MNMSVKIKNKDLNPLIKKADQLLSAFDADIQTLKALGAKGITVKEVKNFRGDLFDAIVDVKVAAEQDDEAAARNYLKTVTELVEEYAIDDTVNPAFTAMVTLGFKSKVAKIIGEESLNEYVVGLGEDLDNVEVIEEENEEE